MSHSPSYVVYRGPSALDPAVQILGVLTLDSSNAKTGPMAQLFIVHATIAPHLAIKTGDDAAICGNCPYRPALVAPGVKPCYVKVWQGPRATWESNRDEPVKLGEAMAALGDASLRLGAYGDPAALPQWLIAALVQAASREITGYTHQWRDPRFAWLRAYVMASCDSVEDYFAAKRAGWRTFRVEQKAAPTRKRHLAMLGAPARTEIQCPSDRGVKCIDCKLCDGNKGEDRRKDIYIPAHN